MQHGAVAAVAEGAERGASAALGIGEQASAWSAWSAITTWSNVSVQLSPHDLDLVGMAPDLARTGMPVLTSPGEGPRDAIDIGALPPVTVRHSGRSVKLSRP
jgi:hypothetical protein